MGSSSYGSYYGHRRIVLNWFNITTERFILWQTINHITIVVMGSYKRTVDFNKAERWRMLLSLQITPILLLALCVFSLIDVWMWALLENISLNIFHLIFADCRFKLKFKIKYQRCMIYFIFRETFPSWACLDGSGFKDISH